MLVCYCKPVIMWALTGYFLEPPVKTAKIQESAFVTYFFDVYVVVFK